MPCYSGSCIAAYADPETGRVYMAADSLAVDSAGTRVDIANAKIIPCGRGLIGVVGSLRVAQVVASIVEQNEPELEGPALMRWLAETIAGELDSAYGVSGDTEWSCLVASAGRVYVLQRDASWYEPAEGFWAEGAGSDAAWAVLWLGWLGRIDMEPEELVRLAIYAAMGRNCRVGARVIVLSC